MVLGGFGLGMVRRKSTEKRGDVTLSFLWFWKAGTLHHAFLR
jgi:hypothetical protein